MLGFAPIAAAPLGATGDAGNTYDASFDDVVEVSSDFAALAVFPAQLPTESSAVQDTVLVAPSFFGADLNAAAAASSTEAALAVFTSFVDEAVSENDTVAAQAIFPVSYEDAAEITDAVLALATFQAAVSELLTAQDSFIGGLVYAVFVQELAAASMVASSRGVLNANTTDVAASIDTPGASASFSTQLSASASGAMTALVAPSTFNAAVSEEADVLDAILASAVFFANITGSAVAIDEVVRRLLWEVINDAQAVSWSGVNTSQATAWGTINNSQTTAWTPVKTQT